MNVNRVCKKRKLLSLKRVKFQFLKSAILFLLSIYFIFNLFQCRPVDYRSQSYNVILISLDTLRADHLSAYGYPKKTSPHIDRWAKKSLLFKNSFSNASWTLPSHMSLMTSLYPSIHGVDDKSKKLSESTRTLAEVLKENGYKTAAFTGGTNVSKVYGFDKGFDFFKESYDATIETPGQGWRLSHIEKSLSSWLNTNVDVKFFLFLHCWDPHEPFIKHSYLSEFESSYSGQLSILDTYSDFIKSPEFKNHEGFFNINLFYNEVINKDLISLTKEDKEHIVALYDNEIRFVDHYFGKLIAHLEHLDLMDKTIIILWSDHGEELFERGKIMHGSARLYDEQIHVPTIVYIPGYRGPKVNSNLVQSIDIAPTILDILGIEPESNFMGISLFSNKNDFILGQHRTKWNMLRTQEFKLMRFSDNDRNTYLFDLKEDPGETVNVFKKKPEIAEQLKTHMLWAISQRPGEKVDESKLTKEDIEKLRALGYIK